MTYFSWGKFWSLKISHIEKFKFLKFVTFHQLIFPDMISLFNFLFNTLAKDEDENEIADEFAEEDLPQNDDEQKQGQNDPWGRRRRRRRRRRSRRGWRRVGRLIRKGIRIYRKYKYIKLGAALLGKKRDEPGFQKADE